MSTFSKNLEQKQAAIKQVETSVEAVENIDSNLLDLGTLNATSPIASLESSSLKITFKTFFTNEITEIIANQMDWQFNATPWGFTPLDKDGNIVESVYERVSKILEASNFDLLRSTIISNMSKYGQAALSWDIMKNDTLGKIPFLNVASGVAKWVQPLGQDVQEAWLVNYFQIGTSPMVWTTQFTKDEIVNQGFKDETGTAISHKKFQLATGYKMKEREKNKYSFLPVVRILNRVVDSSMTPIKDVYGPIMELASRADALWDKILDYIVSNTNQIATVRQQSGFNTPTESRVDQEQIKEYTHQTYRTYVLNNQYVDGSPFQIIKGDFNIAPLWENLIQILQLISFLAGGVPMFDRTGSHQITDTQRFTAARNSSHLINSKKIQYLSAGFEKLLRMLPEIDEESEVDYSAVDSWIIDIHLTEAGVDYELMKNPKNFILAGGHPIDLIKKVHKKTETEARRELERVERAPEQYPNFYKNLFGSKEEESNSNEPRDKSRQNNMVDTQSGDVAYVGE